MNVLNLSNIITGTVIKRPSAYCKTPYVADVLLDNNIEILGHSPSLGCCGLADKDASVILSKIDNNKTKIPYLEQGIRILQFP
jgi:hypothetical protein|uniref:Uncharacterized protein n=1 Tax=viral metagenome TaxID=1070528 RepID=A0A6C0IPI6_9ZZZZ